MSDWLPAVGFTLMPFIGSTFGRVITKNSMDWYDVSKSSENSRSVSTDVYLYLSIALFRHYKNRLGGHQNGRFLLCGLIFMVQWGMPRILFGEMVVALTVQLKKR